MNITNWSYRKKTLILIAAIGILRLIIAFTVELGNDESYYWLYSQHLKSNYFDHPPMIAFWIRATTLNLWLQDYPGFLRLSSVLSCCLASWFMFKCVSLISNERAGLFSVVLYNASFYAGITAGIFIIPDAPQMVFWTLSLWLIAHIVKNDSWKNWLFLGISTGLCIMSKVHGVFIWIGIGFYILLLKRIWLKNVKMYVAVLISFVISLPILIWNIQNKFITYTFDSQRINIYGVTHNWFYLLKEVSGQLLINNPFNVVLIITGLFFWKKRKLGSFPALTIVGFIGSLHAVTLLVISAYKETLPHWSGPAYVSLIPIAAVFLDQKNKITVPLSVRLSLSLHVFILLLCVWLIYFYPGNFGTSSGRYTGYSDVSLDMFAWKQAGEKFDTIYTNDLQDGIVPKNTPVICYKWCGAHLEYYFCRPLNLKMIGLGNLMDLHEYAWMNGLRKDSVDMQHAYCIVPSDEYYNPKRTYRDYYSNIDSIATIETFRGDKPAHNFYVYRLSGWKNKLPVVQ